MNELPHVDEKDMLKKAVSFLNAVVNSNPQRGIIGKMDCPICEGKATVTYTRSTYNGHLHANCSACGMGVME